MLRSLSFALALSLPATAFAFGNDDHWVSGFGQGVKEAIITKGPGNSINVSCGQPVMGHSYTSIYFTLLGKSPDRGDVLLTFDGEMPRAFQLWEGKIGSNSRVGDAQFTAIIDLLKSRSQVNVRFEDGTNATFTLKGSSKAIGTCPSDFSQ